MGCICIDCEHKCPEYRSNYISDRSYYEWVLKADKCEAEKQKVRMYELYRERKTNKG